ncbi:serine-rich adhesin platelets domain-containing [Cystoisospora suis]|uniref:Serine-rich adhesin platelets domain-containing n=1 Tax=Cystoisospora suis TaxID=483139 RepID=A0A2C6L2W9_9APIC|nr:serine-rich adhesin platelets domain-containing [Cystoisospora suis]
MACDGRWRMQSQARPSAELAGDVAVVTVVATAGETGVYLDRSASQGPRRENSRITGPPSCLALELVPTRRSCSPLRRRRSSPRTSACSLVRRFSVPSYCGGTCGSSPLPPSSFAHAATVAAWRAVTGGIAPRGKRGGGRSRFSGFNSDEQKVRESSQAKGGGRRGRSRGEGSYGRRGHDRKHGKGTKQMMQVKENSLSRTWDGTEGRCRRVERQSDVGEELPVPKQSLRLNSFLSRSGGLSCQTPTEKSGAWPLGAVQPPHAVSVVSLPAADKDLQQEQCCVGFSSRTSSPTLGIVSLPSPRRSSPPASAPVSVNRLFRMARVRVRRSSSFPSSNAGRLFFSRSDCLRACRSPAALFLSPSLASSSGQHALASCAVDWLTDERYCRPGTQGMLPSSVRIDEDGRASSRRSAMEEVRPTTEAALPPGDERTEGSADPYGFVNPKQVSALEWETRTEAAADAGLLSLPAALHISTLPEETEGSSAVSEASSSPLQGSDCPRKGATGFLKTGIDNSNEILRPYPKTATSEEPREGGGEVSASCPVEAFGDLSKEVRKAPWREAGIALTHSGAADLDADNTEQTNKDLGATRVSKQQEYLPGSQHGRSVSGVFYGAAVPAATFGQSLTGRLMERELQQMLIEASQEARAECALLQQRLQQVEAENARRAVAVFEAFGGRSRNAGSRWRPGVDSAVRGRVAAVDSSRRKHNRELRGVLSVGEPPVSGPKEITKEACNVSLGVVGDSALEPSMRPCCSVSCGVTTAVSVERGKTEKGLCRGLGLHTASTPLRITRTADSGARCSRSRGGPDLPESLCGHGSYGVASSGSSTPSLRSLDAENASSFYLSPGSQPNCGGCGRDVYPPVSAVTSSSAGHARRTHAALSEKTDSPSLALQVSPLCQLSRSVSEGRTSFPAPLLVSFPVSKRPYLLRKRRARSCCCSSCEVRGGRGRTDERAFIPRWVGQHLSMTPAKKLHQEVGTAPLSQPEQTRQGWSVSTPPHILALPPVSFLRHCSPLLDSRSSQREAVKLSPFPCRLPAPNELAAYGDPETRVPCAPASPATGSAAGSYEPLCASSFAADGKSVALHSSVSCASFSVPVSAVDRVRHIASTPARSGWFPSAEDGAVKRSPRHNKCCCERCADERRSTSDQRSSWHGPLTQMAASFSDYTGDPVDEVSTCSPGSTSEALREEGAFGMATSSSISGLSRSPEKVKPFVPPPEGKLGAAVSFGPVGVSRCGRLLESLFSFFRRRRSVEEGGCGQQAQEGPPTVGSDTPEGRGQRVWNGDKRWMRWRVDSPFVGETGTSAVSRCCDGDRQEDVASPYVSGFSPGPAAQTGADAYAVDTGRPNQSRIRPGGHSTSGLSALCLDSSAHRDTLGSTSTRTSSRTRGSWGSAPLVAQQSSMTNETWCCHCCGAPGSTEVQSAGQEELFGLTAAEDRSRRWGVSGTGDPGDGEAPGSFRHVSGCARGGSKAQRQALSCFCHLNFCWAAKRESAGNDFSSCQSHARAVCSLSIVKSVAKDCPRCKRQVLLEVLRLPSSSTPSGRRRLVRAAPQQPVGFCTCWVDAGGDQGRESTSLSAGSGQMQEAHNADEEIEKVMRASFPRVFDGAAEDHATLLLGGSNDSRSDNLVTSRSRGGAVSDARGQRDQGRSRKPAEEEADSVWSMMLMDM